jgi:hypothetical protein
MSQQVMNVMDSGGFSESWPWKPYTKRTFEKQLQIHHIDHMRAGGSRFPYMGTDGDGCERSEGLFPNFPLEAQYEEDFGKKTLNRSHPSHHHALIRPYLSRRALTAPIVRS